MVFVVFKLYLRKLGYQDLDYGLCLINKNKFLIDKVNLIALLTCLSMLNTGSWNSFLRCTTFRS